MDNIQYINRATGEIEQEEIPAGKTMAFIYGNPVGKIGLNLMFKRKMLSAYGGLFMNSTQSKNRIEPFIKQYGINMEEFIIPENGYKHFNDFFYRKIKPEKRPINKGVVSPADGRVLVFPKIKDTSKFFVKGEEFDVNKFIGNDNIAKKYIGGSMMIVRLAPVDYHRFHFPISGTVSETKHVKGFYYSVSPIALKKNLKIFLQNKREYCSIKTTNNKDVLFMDIGATMTGSIIQTYIPNKTIKKGDEKGYFAFGGSTVVVLFEPNSINFSEDLIQNTRKGFETYIKMGETIGQ